MCFFFLFFLKESLIISLDIFLSESLVCKRYIQFSFGTKTCVELTANNQIQSKFSPLKRQCISATRKQSNIPEKKDLHLKDMITYQA